MCYMFLYKVNTPCWDFNVYKPHSPLWQILWYIWKEKRNLFRVQFLSKICEDGLFKKKKNKNTTQ